jgi:hypothetical protein
MSNLSNYSSDKEQARMAWLLHKVACIPNNKLDWVTKGVVVGISNEFARLGVPHGQLTKVWYPNIAEQSGLSIESVKGGITKLEKVKAIIKEVRAEYNKDTRERNKRVWLSFTPEFLVNPANLFVDAPSSNHGGKRMSVCCPHCGQYHPLHKITSFYCTGCGGMIDHLTETQTVENVSPREEEETEDKHRALLARLDMLIDSSDNYYDAATIPDDVVDEMGGAQVVLQADPLELAERMSIPPEIRQGLDTEDIVLLDEIRQGMYHRNEE